MIWEEEEETAAEEGNPRTLIGQTVGMPVKTARQII